MNDWWRLGPCQNIIIFLDNCTKKSENYINNQTYDIKEENELNEGERYFIIKSFEWFN